MVSYGVVWYDMGLYVMMCNGTVRYGTTLYCKVWFAIACYGIIWYDLVLYGMVWYGTVV